jgi:hypothetical protein
MRRRTLPSVIFAIAGCMAMYLMVENNERRLEQLIAQESETTGGPVSAATPATPTKTRWATFKSDDGGYSIQLPVSRLTRRRIKAPTICGDMEFTEIATDATGISFSVSHAAVPSEVRKGFDDHALVAMRAMLLGGRGYTVGENKFEPWKGYPAFQGEFPRTDGSQTLFMRSVLAGDKLYWLIAEVPAARVQSDHQFYEHFFDSFQATAGR